MRGRTITLTVTDKRGKAAKTIPLYQYDYGQKLLIEGVELPEYYEVHFANELYGESVTVVGDSTGALIPDSLLATGQTIYVWIYLHDTISDGETEYQGVIPVIRRAEPSDIDPTPEEQSEITQIIALLNNVAGECEDMKDDSEEAAQAAQTAQAAAEAAQTEAEGSVTAVTDAKDAALAAQAAAETAQAAAESAQSSAETAYTNASNAASSAETSATSAASSASSASTYQSQASSSATAANTSKVAAENAQTAAETAQTGAETAQTAAETAQSAAEVAQGAAETAQSAAETAQGAAETAQGAAETAQGLAETAQSAAEAAQTAAESAASDSEAYAVGTRNGVDVESDDPAYENNAKYYAGVAETVVADKADLVSDATYGNFASLDSDGNLMDSGKSPSDFALSTDIPDVSGFYTKPGTGIPASDIEEGVIPDVSDLLEAPSVAGTQGQVLTSDGEGGQAWADPTGGDPTEIIDDTAGDGDTDKTWSADKLHDEFASVMTDITEKVPKSALDNTGITNKTFISALNTTVTTASDGEHDYPIVKVANISIDGTSKYKVTINNNEYILNAGNWYEPSDKKGYEFVGNLELYGVTLTGIENNNTTLNFCIVHSANIFDGLQIFTSTAGQYTIKIERLIYTKTDLPSPLIYGNEEQIVKRDYYGGSSYESVGIGRNVINGKASFAIGFGNVISKGSCIAIGEHNTLSGGSAYVIGRSNNVSGDYAFSEGVGNTASGIKSHTEGNGNTASGETSHAEGQSTTASGIGSHSEGYSSSATNTCAHAEGYQTSALNTYAHSEGQRTTASGSASHSEGRNTTASAAYAHAEGYSSTASGAVAHVEGQGTIANHRSQHVSGEFNVADPSTAGNTDLGNYLEIIGNGTADNARSNARTLDTDGNERIKGDLYVGCNADSSGGTKVEPVVTETVSGSTPSITGVANHRYICGECSTLSITAPASGCIDVLFESGSTATVLTVTSAKSGVNAVKWANGFDPTSLDASTIYEINIMDGEFGVVCSWT